MFRLESRKFRYKALAHSKCQAQICFVFFLNIPNAQYLRVPTVFNAGLLWIEWQDFPPTFLIATMTRTHEICGMPCCISLSSLLSKSRSLFFLTTSQGVLSTVLGCTQDSHPRVVWACLGALASLLSCHGPDLQAKHHGEIMPALAPLLNVGTHSRIRSRATRVRNIKIL